MDRKPIRQIKRLRKFARFSRRWDHVLDRCAIYETVDRVLHSDLPPLTLRHLFGVSTLPTRSAEVIAYPGVHGRNPAVLADVTTG